MVCSLQAMRRKGELLEWSKLLPFAAQKIKSVMKTVALVSLLALCACDGPRPISKENADAHAKAYVACASVAKNEMQLSNCGFAVENMR